MEDNKPETVSRESDKSYESLPADTNAKVKKSDSQTVTREIDATRQAEILEHARREEGFKRA